MFEFRYYSRLLVGVTDLTKKSVGCECLSDNKLLRNSNCRGFVISGKLTGVKYEFGVSVSRLPHNKFSMSNCNCQGVIVTTKE